VVGKGKGDARLQDPRSAIPSSVSLETLNDVMCPPRFLRGNLWRGIGVASLQAGVDRRAEGGSSLPDGDDCRAQLDRILSSEAFPVSPRHRRFLSYIVTEALEGRADRIKAYTVAMEVFGRDASFDPQNDPIVRVEAGHLRRGLERYYLDAGRFDPVEIAVPKGSYVPHFAWRAPAAAVASDSAPAPAKSGWSALGAQRGLLALALAAALLVVGFASWMFVAGGQKPTQPDLPRLIVQPFEDLSRTGKSAAIAEGLTQEVIGQIAKFRDLVVFYGSEGGDPPARADAPSAMAARYALAGTVEIEDATLRLQARLISRADGSILWANTYAGDLSVSQVLQIERDIAEQVATALGQPYGVIFQADASRQVARPPEDWAAYACTLSYYSYRTSMDSETHPAIRQCLKEAVARFPTYATAWGLLSQVYIDEVRFRFPPDPSDGPASIERALAAARKAVELDPVNIRGQQAEMFALYFAGDIDAAIRVGRKALAINPNDTELQGEVGYRLALSGDWAAGCPLVASAREANPGPLGYYESALALCAYQRGDLAEAKMWIGKVPPSENPQYHLIAAAIYGEIGDPAGASEIEWVRAHASHLYTDARREITLRVAREEDVDRFMKSLEKAGLPPGE
jgi:TolB-like protein